jgi:hypothetical protein
VEGYAVTGPLLSLILEVVWVKGRVIGLNGIGEMIGFWKTNCEDLMIVILNISVDRGG